jgi:hypothetical protein
MPWKNYDDGRFHHRYDHVRFVVRRGSEVSSEQNRSEEGNIDPKKL